ncbi:MAG: hypothetical protein PHF63_00485 [Herbinix sp.]|nr:hypothetical protein [Herbinix sp.]
MDNYSRSLVFEHYIINAEEKEEYGVFFRLPITKVEVSDSGYKQLSPWSFIKKLKENVLFRLFHLMINRRITLDLLKNGMGDDCCGFYINKFVSPIYFKRSYRRTVARAMKPDLEIESIVSYGYESEYEVVCGRCVVEKTIIKTTNGTRKIINKGEYKFTYIHNMTEFLRGERI